MIDRQRLLADLKPLLREMETDLRAQCDEVAQVNAGLVKEYEEARAAERTGETLEEWRADLITQVGAAWILSCVFVRFMEDNALIAPPKLAGLAHADEGLQRARDERDLYFRTHAKLSDRDYLLAVFAEVGKLPGAKELFGKHNPVNEYPDWLSGDAAQRLIEFFQKIDADGTGEIIHDFTDAQWDTRFLGDLYQDLSEAARKKYALLQTPVFVEEFILERTLEPAIKEFGLKDFKMIDPASGSGHFVLGSFTRILNHWRKAEPGANERELVNRALASVHGVDLNPYAVAIARFRLLLAAMKECQITRLKDAPNFQFNLACGDSLLHGSANGRQQVLDFHEMAHHYQSEDRDELHRILRAGQYQAVVANPPYITVKDKALSLAYRERYPEVCYRKYSLSAPFIQRLFNLAIHSGFVGQITANSFMKREFGRKMVEAFLPTIDLTHIVNTSGAFIPGHTTPTVIMFGRNREPVAPVVRTVLSTKGEPGTPDDPAKGIVWNTILAQLDHVDTHNDFISVVDVSRSQLSKHPWATGGGGAAELKQGLDERADKILDEYIECAGFSAIIGEDEAFCMPKNSAHLKSLPHAFVRPILEGELIRDWSLSWGNEALFPYDDEVSLVNNEVICKFLWPMRVFLGARSDFSGKAYQDCGRTYWEYHQIPADRNRAHLLLVFGSVATHNHFVLDHGGKIFKQSAPVLTLKSRYDENDYVALLGLLNTSLACFWMKQVFNCKGLGGQGGGIKPEEWHRAYEFDSTKLRMFPVPESVHRCEAMARRITFLADEVKERTPVAVVSRGGADRKEALEEGRHSSSRVYRQMVALQEELDWLVYDLFGLTTYRAAPEEAIQHGLHPQDRPVEVLHRRRMEAGESSIFYDVHKCRGASEAGDMHPVMREIVEERTREIERNSNLQLVEKVNFKRRWQIESWDSRVSAGLWRWLLDRLEGYFDCDGGMRVELEVTKGSEKAGADAASGAAGSADSSSSLPSSASSSRLRAFVLNPALISVAKAADLAKQDNDFMQVAELYTGRMDFDVASFVGDLVAAESVPCLPALRYKPSGLDKRAAWERTWELQRLEDAVDALFDVERLRKIRPGKAEETLRPLVAALRIGEQAKPKVLREAISAADYVAEAIKQKLSLTSDVILEPVTDAAKHAKKEAVGDIPVPPKYTSADFQSSTYWRLRGKLDVPKERWISFPHCEGEDGTLLIAWAGYDHLQLARAIAERYEHAKEQEGRKLVPLLACIGQLIPWLKQWHNEPDMAFGGIRMGDHFEGYLAEEAKALGMSVDQVMAWAPPTKTEARARKTRAKSRHTDVIRRPSVEKAPLQLAAVEPTPEEIENGTAVLYALALLHAWGKPVDRQPFELGMILMQKDGLRNRVLQRQKAAMPAQSQPLSMTVGNMDEFLGEIVGSGVVDASTIGGDQVVRLGLQAPKKVDIQQHSSGAEAMAKAEQAVQAVSIVEEQSWALSLFMGAEDHGSLKIALS